MGNIRIVYERAKISNISKDILIVQYQLKVLAKKFW